MLPTVFNRWCIRGSEALAGFNPYKIIATDAVAVLWGKMRSLGTVLRSIKNLFSRRSIITRRSFRSRAFAPDRYCKLSSVPRRSCFPAQQLVDSRGEHPMNFRRVAVNDAGLPPLARFHRKDKGLAGNKYDLGFRIWSRFALVKRRPYRMPAAVGDTADAPEAVARGYDRGRYLGARPASGR